MSAAKLTAFTTLRNSARKPSPSVLTMRPPRLGDQRVDDGGLPLHQLGQRARLVALHQPRVARDIGRKDCGEAPFQARQSPRESMESSEVTVNIRS